MVRATRPAKSGKAPLGHCPIGDVTDSAPNATSETDQDGAFADRRPASVWFEPAPRPEGGGRHRPDSAAAVGRWRVGASVYEDGIPQSSPPDDLPFGRAPSYGSRADATEQFGRLYDERRLHDDVPGPYSASALEADTAGYPLVPGCTGPNPIVSTEPAETAEPAGRAEPAEPAGRAEPAEPAGLTATPAGSAASLPAVSQPPGTTPPETAPPAPGRSTTAPRTMPLTTTNVEVRERRPSPYARRHSRRRAASAPSAAPAASGSPTIPTTSGHPAIPAVPTAPDPRTVELTRAAPESGGQPAFLGSQTPETPQTPGTPPALGTPQTPGTPPALDTPPVPGEWPVVSTPPATRSESEPMAVADQSLAADQADGGEPTGEPVPAEPTDPEDGQNSDARPPEPRARAADHPATGRSGGSQWADAYLIEDGSSRSSGSAPMADGKRCGPAASAAEPSSETDPATAAGAAAAPAVTPAVTPAAGDRQPGEQPPVAAAPETIRPWPIPQPHAGRGVLTSPAPRQRRPRATKPSRRPGTGLLVIVAIALISAFFAWVSAEPIWIVAGHSTTGTATVVKCTGSGVQRRCQASFVDEAGQVVSARVPLVGADADQERVGAKVPARMVSERGRTAYAGDGRGLQAGWVAGIVIIVLCGIVLAWAGGATRLPTRRTRVAGVLTSLAAPLVLLLGMLAAAW